MNKTIKWRLVMDDYEVKYIYLLTLPEGQKLDPAIDADMVFDSSVALIDKVAILSDEDYVDENMEKAIAMVNKLQKEINEEMEMA